MKDVTLNPTLKPTRKIFLKYFQSYIKNQFKKHIYPNIILSFFLAFFVITLNQLLKYDIQIILDSIYSQIFFFITISILQIITLSVILIKEIKGFTSFRRIEKITEYAIKKIQESKQKNKNIINDLLAIMFGLFSFTLTYLLICNRDAFYALLIPKLCFIVVTYLLSFMTNDDSISLITQTLSKKAKQEKNRNISKKLLQIIIHTGIFTICIYFLIQEINKI